MRILICGAGKVGSSIARQLSRENNEVTVIDYNPELIQQVNEQLDVQAHLGYASHPSTLKAARAEDADMLIAVTYSDEVNMTACQIGYSLFNIPIRIARIRHQDYLKPEWASLYSNDQLALNVIISPEIEVAEAILRRLHAPGSLDSIPFANDLVRVVALRCMDDCPVINLPVAMIREKAAGLNMNMIGLVQNGKFIIPNDQTILHAGDDVYFISPSKQVRKVMALFGHHESEARRGLILGGGNVGLLLAQKLEADEDHDIKVKLIEYDPKRAEHVAQQLSKTTVLCGDAMNREILQEAGIEMCEAVMAVTNDDETNILGALLAKQFGAERTMTLVNNATYSPLLGDLGIDVTVNPRETTVSKILQHVRRGKISAVHAISDGMAEILEAEVMATSSILGKPMGDLKLPDGIIFGGIVRGEALIIPKNDTIIAEGDHIIILALANMVRKVEKIFSVGVEYF